MQYLDPTKTELLVIHMQPSFTEQEVGPNPMNYSRPLMNLCGLITRSPRELGRTLIEMKNQGPTHKWITQAISQSNESARYVKGQDMSAFDTSSSSLGLNNYLKSQGRDTVLITGTKPNGCAAVSAIEALNLGYNVVGVYDALFPAYRSDNASTWKEGVLSEVTSVPADKLQLATTQEVLTALRPTR